MGNPVLFIIPGACSLGSMIALERSEVPYQIGITTAEIRASTTFRNINPTGKVGALKDAKQIVGENLAILLYLTDKYPKLHLEIGSEKRTRVYQWLSYLSSTLHTTFGQVLYPERFMPGPAAEEFKRLANDKLKSILHYIDDSLLDSGYFIDSIPTIVDGQAYGLLRWCKGFHNTSPTVDIAQFKKIQKFFTLMEQLSAVKNALAIEQQQLSMLTNSKFAGYFNF